MDFSSFTDAQVSYLDDLLDHENDRARHYPDEITNPEALAEYSKAVYAECKRRKIY